MKINSGNTMVVTGWGQGQENLTSEEAATAARVHEEELKAGVVFDTSLSYTVEFLPTQEEREAFDYRVALYHRSMPMLEADSAINTIEDQLGKVQKSIANERPDLAKSSWDMTVVKGKLVVTGPMNEADKTWLESKLNANSSLKAAVNSYMKAATDYLETNEENPAHGGMSPINSQLVSYNFKDVQGQLEGKIAFKDLIAATWKLYEHGNDVVSDPANYRGGDSLEMLALQLVPEPE